MFPKAPARHRPVSFAAGGTHGTSGTSSASNLTVILASGHAQSKPDFRSATERSGNILALKDRESAPEQRLADGSRDNVTTVAVTFRNILPIRPAGLTMCAACLGDPRGAHLLGGCRFCARGAVS